MEVEQDSDEDSENDSGWVGPDTEDDEQAEANSPGPVGAGGHKRNLNPHESSDLLIMVTRCMRTLTYREQRPMQHPQFWQSPGLKRALTKHMYTMQEAQIGVLDVSAYAKWHSAAPGDAQLGAATVSLVNFMTDAFTWVNMPRKAEGTTAVLADAISAVNASAEPARVLLLCRATQPLPRSTQARVHLLVRIPRGALRLTYASSQGTITRANTEPLVVIQIENKAAPPTNYAKLRINLEDIMKVRQPECIPPPWAPVGRNYHRLELQEFAHRPPYHERPAVSWCRTEPKMIKGVLCHPSPLARLLTAIGAGPEDLKGILRGSRAPQNILTTEIMNRLKSHARDTAFKAFTRQIRWSKEDKFGPQGPMPDPKW